MFDSYAWIGFFRGTNVGEKVMGLLENCDDPITPSIVLAEPANKYLREGSTEEKVLERVRIITSLLRIADINVDVIRMLSEARKKLLENGEKIGIKKKPVWRTLLCLQPL